MAFKKNKNEILYNIINSILAGALVFAGSCASGQITKTGLLVAIGASGIVAITKFKEYWDGEKREYTTKIFNFI
jgi:hypothetical protein